MKRIVATVVLFTANLSLAITAIPVAGADSAEAAVRAAETARTTALIHADLPALDKLMAEDVTYVHASGKMDTKSSYLDALRSGQLRYISWQLKKLNVRVSGETAVLDGVYLVRANDFRVQHDPIDITVFFLTVYARRDGRWRQIAWQSTKAPPSVN
ncbi:MAG TPA: nuclear transport factor 2 family protein [Verrucomicrobiae bacterium]|nr:nuclear transport factor 2 family protein [Verrucomicrobiae bacterium]